MMECKQTRAGPRMECAIGKPSTLSMTHVSVARDGETKTFLAESNGCDHICHTPVS